MSQSKLFDIKYQLLQYASHHNNVWNVGIHLTCIPLILWSGLVFAANTGPLITYPSAAAVASGATIPVALSKLFAFATPNAAWLMMTGYVSYYFALDKETAVSPSFGSWLRTIGIQIDAKIQRLVAPRVAFIFSSHIAFFFSLFSLHMLRTNFLHGYHG